VSHGTKNNYMNYCLIVYNMCSWITQVTKDFFFPNEISQTEDIGNRREGGEGRGMALFEPPGFFLSVDFLPTNVKGQRGLTLILH
jgi:hypothetical protein